MKTTLDIDESVMQQLRETAARRGAAMSALVEAGIRRVLSQAPSAHEQGDALPPLPTWHSDGARVEISNREEL